MEQVAVMRTASAAETGEAGRLLGTLLRRGDVVALSGDLGAGKTRLTQGVGVGLGIGGQVVSPTFNILMVHDDGQVPLYHFDLYRLARASELDDIDFFGTLEAGGACVVEWGDRFPEALPDDTLDVEITIDAVDSRTLTLRAGGPRAAALAAKWARTWESRRR
jgi:tRNA threonylcarbamoyladenosine biosynthesis protein TsaE